MNPTPGDLINSGKPGLALEFAKLDASAKAASTAALHKTVSDYYAKWGSLGEVDGAAATIQVSDERIADYVAASGDAVPVMTAIPGQTRRKATRLFLRKRREWDRRALQWLLDQGSETALMLARPLCGAPLYSAARGIPMPKPDGMRPLILIDEIESDEPVILPPLTMNPTHTHGIILQGSYPPPPQLQDPPVTGEHGNQSQAT